VFPLDVRSLSKRYRKLDALSDLSFTVSSGEIVGLLGPNGAGKTTSLRCIAGIVRPTGGSIFVSGSDLLSGGEAERDAKRRVAFVPEQPNPYELLTVWEHLKFIALAYDTMDGFDERAADLLVRYDLAAKRDALVGTLSKGMRQKLTIACAFIRHASVFLFDEPLIGLDPKGARELREHLVAAREAGAAIVVSTHMLDTAQTLCDRIVILRHGRMVAEGTLDALRERAHATGFASLEEVFFTLTAEHGESPAIPTASSDVVR
jgi:ABC-2 type transport system ATP-binding protein